MNVQSILLLICIVIVFALGLVMIFGTSSAEVLNLALNKSTHQALFRQMIYAVVGACCAFLVYILRYQNLLKLSFFLWCICVVLLILTFVPGIGQVRNGAHRWVGFAGYTFQPSELVKFLVPIYYLNVVLQFREGSMTLSSFLKVVAVCVIPVFLIIAEPDNGTAAIILATLVMLFFITRIKLAYWTWPILILLIVGGMAAYQLPYVSARLSSYVNPDADLLGRGHQSYQAKIAAGTGQLFGRGVGQSLQKLNYLPEAQNDYIAAIYAEEFGFIGVMILISLYMLITYLGFYIAYHAVDKEGFHLAVAITFVIALQVFLNLGVVSGMLPSTGLNLPFFSQGGTSLMANIMAIGILLDISRQGKQACKVFGRRKNYE